MGDNKISLNIQVFCRVRPPNSSEEVAEENISFPNAESICLPSGKVYSFDKIYTPESSQNDVYDGTAKSIIKDVLNGYNATVFAYGPTSSGKTFTMEGNIKSEDEMGIMPRIGSDVFLEILSAENVYEIKVSFVEIYLEKIRDLLNEKNQNCLSVYESRDKPPMISGVKEVIVKNFNEFLEQLEIGCSNRVVSATERNERSSRSHSIMQIVIQQENPNTQQKLIGKLLLVDLAGSEVLSNTNSEVFRESKYINKSLSTLAHVICELSKRSKHIPYRDSILTRLLKESLGGNAKTIIIICVAPNSVAQTKCSLEFGSRAKVVKNSVSVNSKTENKKWKEMFEKANLSLQSLQIYVQELENKMAKQRYAQEIPKDEWAQLPEASKGSSSFSDMSGSSFLSVVNQSNNCDMSQSSFLSVVNQSNNTIVNDSEEVIDLKNQVDRLERQVADLQNQQVSLLAEQENMWIKCIEEEKVNAEQTCQILTRKLKAASIENYSNVAEIEQYKTLKNALQEELAQTQSQLNKSKECILDKEKKIEHLRKENNDSKASYEKELKKVVLQMESHEVSCNIKVDNLLKENEKLQNNLENADNERNYILHYVSVLTKELQNAGT